MGLNAREKKFCEEYAISGNGTQSAILAGYKETSAAPTASRLLRKDKVKQYLDELKKPLEDERKSYIQIINESRAEAAERLVMLMRSHLPLVAIRACEDILQLDRIDPTKDKPELPPVKVEFVDAD